MNRFWTSCAKGKQQLCNFQRSREVLYFGPENKKGKYIQDYARSPSALVLKSSLEISQVNLDCSSTT